MKIATVFYDKRGIIVQPPKFWDKPHPKMSSLTIDGGYWHLCQRDYHASQIPGGLDSSYRPSREAIAAAEHERDLSMNDAMAAVADNNGTILNIIPVTMIRRNGRLTIVEEDQLEHLEPADDVVFRWRMLYVIEEPDRVPFIKFAAKIDRIGVDPDFEYPYDGVAEHGPDYRTPPHQQLAHNTALLDLTDPDKFVPVMDDPHLRMPEFVPEDGPDF